MFDRTRWFALMLGVGVIALTACSASGDAPADGDAAPNSVATEAAAEAPVTEVDEPSATEIPCGVVTSAELESVVGVAVGDGRTVTTMASSNDLKWNPQRCSWDVDDVVEVDLTFADATSFTAGEYTCVEPIGLDDPVVVEGLGSAARWTFRDFSGADGQLRVCLDESFFDVGISTPAGDSATMQAQAVAIATLIAERI